MTRFPVFLSVVFVARNQSANIENFLSDAVASIADLVSEYEVIIIDNASDDTSVELLKRLTGEDGLPNLQVYALTKELDMDTASWVGLENALGDFVAVLDPFVDDIQFLPDMIDRAVSGTDVVFAKNEMEPEQSLAYRTAYAAFNQMYQWINDVHLARGAPHYRILSKRIVNFILQHPQPAVVYRHIALTGGFSRANLNYSSALKFPPRKKVLWESIDRGMRLLVSTTRAPMRFVTALSLFGAAANLVYSMYVIVIGFFKADIAPGWTSLSLQQSGMFFLISLVLLFLGEYILHMASLSNEGPLYHVAQEFTSMRLTSREKLNVEEILPTTTPASRRGD